jgi:hypothetical protein
VRIIVESLGLATVDVSRNVSQPLFSLRSPPPPLPTRALSPPKHHRFRSSLFQGHVNSMNSRTRVSVLCFWLFFPAFRPILCCCVHIFDATVTSPSFASTARHLRSPSRHTTFGRLLRHLRRISRRDRPSRYGSFETLSCTSATPLVGLRPHHSSALGHDWALGSTHPSQPPRKQ